MKFQLGTKLPVLVALVAVAVAVIVCWGSDQPVILKVSWQDGFEITIPNAEMVDELMRNETEDQKKTRKHVLAILADYQVYELNNTKTAKRVLALGYEHPLIVELRRAVINGDPVIWPKEHNVKLLKQDELKDNQAAVCKGSEFSDNQVILFRLNGRSRQVWLDAGQLLDSDDCEATPNRLIGVSKEVIVRMNKNGGLTGFKARAELKDYRLHPASLPLPVANLGNGTSARGEN